MGHAHTQSRLGVLRSLCRAIVPCASLFVVACGSTADVYVAGYGSQAGLDANRVATLWKNGVATRLTDGTWEAYARSVAVSGGDVYATGYEYDGAHYIAKVWKNGVATDLTDGTHQARANSILANSH